MIQWLAIGGVAAKFLAANSNTPEQTKQWNQIAELCGGIGNLNLGSEEKKTSPEDEEKKSESTTKKGEKAAEKKPQGEEKSANTPTAARPPLQVATSAAPALQVAMTPEPMVPPAPSTASADTTSAHLAFPGLSSSHPLLQAMT